ncbi:MAG: serine protease [Pseudomonadota bacterium]
MVANDEDPLDRLIQAIRRGDAGAIDQASAATRNGENNEVDHAPIIEQVRSAAAAGDFDRLEQLSLRYAERLRKNAVRFPATFLSELASAVDRFDRDKAKSLCEDLVQYHYGDGEPYPLATQKGILSTLQRKRYFDLMVTVGDVLIMRNGAIADAGSATTREAKASIRRRYAQALIDSGQLAAALAVLEPLVAECRDHGIMSERYEAEGLVGRVHKQFYMNAAKADSNAKPAEDFRSALDQAINAYAGPYESDEKNLWHGINTAALVKRADRDGTGIVSNRDVTGDARRILKRIVAMKTPTIWDFATAAEACLALGNYPEALAWATQYAGAEGADAFEYASTLRQFEEVWKLDPEDPQQARVLQLLRSALLDKDGGVVAIHDPTRTVKQAHELADDGEFERVLGKDRYKTYKWYVTGLDRATAVAKIYNPVGDGIGTGFLVKGSDVHERITDDWVFMTNAHVVSDDPAEQQASPAALAPEDATVVFQAGPDAGKAFSLGEMIFTSNRNALDCSILTLEQTTAFDRPFRIAKNLPAVGEGKRARVYVIGHPRGAGLSFSLHDNLLLDHQAPKVHYRAPTEGGSSGSPVFNANWFLIALHHLGGESIQRLNNKPGLYGANEGISMQSILRAVAGDLG